MSCTSVRSSSSGTDSEPDTQSNMEWSEEYSVRESSGTDDLGSGYWSGSGYGSNRTLSATYSCSLFHECSRVAGKISQSYLQSSELDSRELKTWNGSYTVDSVESDVEQSHWTGELQSLEKPSPQDQTSGSWNSKGSSKSKEDTSSRKQKKKKPLKVWPRYGAVIDNTFQIFERIGQGSYGTVYRAKSFHNNLSLAIKIEQKQTHSWESPVDRQYGWLQSMRGKEGIPTVYAYGTWRIWQYIVMDQLGPSLSDIWEEIPRGKMELQSVAVIGEKLLGTLETIHQNGLVHRDFKPGNIVMSLGKDDTLFVIDYGLTAPFKKNTRPQEPADCRVGTSLYMSVRAHKGYAQTPRDDLISLGYTLMEMRHGDLPWYGLKSKESIMQKKKNVVRSKMIEPEIAEFLHECEHTKPAQTPDYGKLRAILRRMLTDSKGGLEEQYRAARLAARKKQLDKLHPKKFENTKKFSKGRKGGRKK